MSEPTPPSGDPRLRDLFQALPRRRAPGEECPKPAELWASARGEVGPERQRWLIGHTGRCPSCAEDWRLARHLEHGERDVGTAFGAPSGADRTGRLQRFALAATVILAVAVAALWAAHSGLWERSSVSRSGDQEAGETIVAVTPEGEPLSRDRPVLRWRGPGDGEGVRYDLRVTTENLKKVAQARRLTTPEYRLPAEAIADLPSGTVLLWQVEASSPDEPSDTSPTYRVRLE